MDDIDRMQELIDEIVFYVVDGCDKCPFCIGRSQCEIDSEEEKDCRDLVKEYFGWRDK